MARFAGPIAFLLAVTVAVLIVRSSLSDGDGGASTPAATSTAGGTTAPTLPRRRTTPPTGGARFYSIQAGDTLETVAAQFDTSVERLLVLNPDVDPVALGIGDRVRVK
ncbi:MAG: LysM domain-containing protein [Gaiellaceae bacterium]